LRQVYWGNPYSLADRDDDSNHSNDVPVAIDVRAAAIDVSTSVANVSAVVACVSTASVDVSAATVDLCPFDAALADVSAAVVDASAYFANMMDVAVDVSADVDVANINFVPAGLNHATSLYENIMSVSRRKFTGWSVEPSYVTGINNQHEMWIRQVMLDDWGIQFPHEFQIPAIHHVAFHRNQIVYIVAKKGSGKLAILLLIGLLQTRVTLLMVPLVGLGSDQVNNSRNSNNLIEAYHLDKNRGRDGYALRSRLLSLHPREAECVSIFLYASPQSLKEGSFWYKCLFELLSKNLIRLICIDEAHSIAQDDRNFRPEFCSAVKTQRSIYNSQTTKCNRIAMSATFCQCDQDVITDLFGRPPDKVMWLELSRRGIHFNVII
jgi:hypothetical protein